MFHSMDYFFMRDPKPSREFCQIFDGYLDLCGFSEYQNRGIIFFLGATSVDNARGNFFAKGDIDAFCQSLALYSKDYTLALSYSKYDYIRDCIYDFNLLISQVKEEKLSLDSQIKEIDSDRFSQLKGETNPIRVEMPPLASLNLNTAQEYCELFFETIGYYLHYIGFDMNNAYSLGVVYRLNYGDLEEGGISFLLKRIFDFLTPLYKALIGSPILYIKDPELIKNIHLVSLIMGELNGKGNTELFKTTRIIGLYHQHILYKPQSFDLKPEWNFNSNNDEGFGVRTFHKALLILTLDPAERPPFSAVAKFLYDPYFDNAIMDMQTFTRRILDLMKNKYGLDGYYEFIKSKQLEGPKRDPGWSSTGSYMQFLTILFFETAIHSLVLQEIRR